MPYAMIDVGSTSIILFSRNGTEKNVYIFHLGVPKAAISVTYEKADGGGLDIFFLGRAGSGH